MEEIVLQQRNAPRPVTGKGFVLGVAAVIVRLALAQIIVNALIVLTGAGLLNIVFYLYAVWTLVRFMTRTVAGSAYTLKANTLTLQRLLGDSTISVTEIPLDRIVSVRPVVCADRLKSSYRMETVVDARAATPVRMRLAFGLALFSAALARKMAGALAYEHRGTAIVYEEDGRRHVCVILPDEAMSAALEAALPGVFGVDERTKENVPPSMMAQALERAFPQLYAHVEPLVDEARAEAAKQEIARQKRARTAKRAKNENDHTGEGEGKQDEVQDDTL